MKASKIDFKTFGLIESIRSSKGFRKMIREIRENNHIPQKGFDITKYDELLVKEKYLRIPSKINKNVFLADLKDLLLCYNLSTDWLDFFSDYILYNLFNFSGDYSEKRQILTLDLGSKTLTKESNEKILSDAKNFDLNSVAILLPNFLSQRELMEYIEVNFGAIEKIQKKYTEGKIRKISNKEMRQETFKKIIRNKFIYEHRDLKKRELASEVNKKFKQNLDHTYLSKIIREEINKRTPWWEKKKKV